MARSTVIINFSVPPQLAKLIDQTAKKQNKTRSELLRAAFSSYLFEERFKELQKTGRALAEKLGLETYDDIEEYFG